MKNDLHKKYMNEAIIEAKKAFSMDEVPIGAIIVDSNGNIISRAHNLKKSSNSPIAHAEILAIEKAAKKLDSWRLNDLIIYVTSEPCLMCFGAIMESRIKTLVYSLKMESYGNIDILTNLNNVKLNHKLEIVSGINQREVRELMNNFFSKLRNK